MQFCDFYLQLTISVGFVFARFVMLTLTIWYQIIKTSFGMTCKIANLKFIFFVVCFHILSFFVVAEKNEKKKHSLIYTVSYHIAIYHHSWIRIAYVNGAKLLFDSYVWVGKLKTFHQQKPQHFLLSLGYFLFCLRIQLCCISDCVGKEHRNENDGLLQSSKINFISICGQYR